MLGSLAFGVSAALAACTPCDADSGIRSRVPDRPTSFLRTSWSADPFALGSYSYLAASDLGSSAREVLAAPAGRLFFAGEATSTSAPATTTGAWESGERAAAAVADTTGPVIVVGAGFAGLAAARALVAAGREVTVVEGRDRTGGRAHTVAFAGGVADLGASWIHGAADNPMTALAADAGTRLIPFDYENQIGADEAALEWLEEVAWEASDADDPEARPLSDLLPTTLTAGQTWAVAVEVAGEYGADPDRLAIAALDEGDEQRVGDALLSDGYGALVSEAATGLDIRTDWPVTRITQDAAGVTLTADGGQTLTGGVAIVTVPLGVLQAGAIAFDPPLPEEKTAAISALGMGLLDKLWLAFDEVFWDPDVDVINIVDPENPRAWPFWVNGYKAFGLPILLGFAGGAAAERNARLTDDELVASAMATLRAAFSSGSR